MQPNLNYILEEIIGEAGDRQVTFDAASRVQHLGVGQGARRLCDIAGCDPAKRLLGISTGHDELGERALIKKANTLANRLVLRAEDREERTMWVRGLQRRIAERRGRATGHPAEALASPRGADGEKTNTDESTASDDGSTTTSASHANAPAATTPTRLKARYEEEDDDVAAAHQHDEPRMSPVTEVVAAQQSPDARRPPPAAAWGSDRATSEVLEMSSPDALSEF